VRRPSAFQEDTQSGGSMACSKNFWSKAFGTWGLFFVFCACGHMYGFHEILNAEGRKDAYYVLRYLMKEAPKVVIYDFACQLEEYCMARDPEYFKDTVFLIDHFHTYNHTCSRIYKISAYPVLNYLNSEIAEQGNSWVKSGTRQQAKQLREDTFSLLIMALRAMWNEEKDEKIAGRDTKRRRMEDAAGV
jgi:hypothetical protein